MKQNVRILLAEDDNNLGLLLNEYLNAKGFETILCDNGNSAYKEFNKSSFDICILDVMMPLKDGFTLAKDIRLINKDIPIIFLTAKSLKEDIVEGLKLGADDYITKPFSMEELLLRIHAILRRTGNTTEDENKIFNLGKLVFNPQKQELKDGKKSIKLTTKEAGLLKLLCNNSNKILERNVALKKIWFDDNYFTARSMDVYITKLRKHLQVDKNVEILNVHGKGYKLIVPEISTE